MSFFDISEWQRALAELPVRDVAIDIGQNLSLHCTNDESSTYTRDFLPVMWIRDGREDGQIQRSKVKPNGTLELVNVTKHDAGNYSCTLDNDADAVKISYNVRVRSELEFLNENIFYNIRTKEILPEEAQKLKI